MTTAILDTNVIIQAIISSPRSASPRVMQAYDDGKYRLILSPATIDELASVLRVPRIRSRHGWSDDRISRFVFLISTDADIYPGQHSVPEAVARDVTDTKFLALAEESRVDYLVTNDRRHLLRLSRHGQTRIVTPARFLKGLG